MSIYIVVIALLIISILSFGADQKLILSIAAAGAVAIFLASTNYKKKAKKPLGFGLTHPSDGSKLTADEKRLIIFYILAIVEKKGALDMNELAKDIQVSIYTLSKIMEFLEKNNAIIAEYPPMHNFPVLHKGDQQKMRAYMKKIYDDRARKDLVGKLKFEDFIREVEAYIHTIKR